MMKRTKKKPSFSCDVNLGASSGNAKWLTVWMPKLYGENQGTNS